MEKRSIEEIVKNVMEELIGDKPAAAHIGLNSCDTTIPIELSARHAHLSEKDAIELFGAPLTFDRELSQPGQYLCKERVRLIGPKGVINNVAILGPSRSKSQVEISKTDARTLGTATPVRQSGDTSGTPGVILASQSGIVGLEEGLIVAGRHIHMTPDEAEKLNVSDNEMVRVHLDSERPVVLEDVLVRTNKNFKLSMHIDLDEGNGSGWDNNVLGKIVAKN